MHQSLFFHKVAGSGLRFFCEFFEFFKSTLLQKTSPDGCFCYGLSSFGKEGHHPQLHTLPES